MKRIQFKILTCAVIAALLLWQASHLMFVGSVMAQQGEQSISAYSRNLLPSNVLPEHYDLLVTPHPDKSRFHGSVRIDFRVQEPTSEIVLNAADIQLTRAILVSSGEEASELRVDQKDETVTLRFGRTLEIGAHVLAIEYEGKISERSEGLFISRYGTPDDPKHMLATQFEPASARRFLPCWDEPARKASFSISVEVPRGEGAVSNMPAEQTTALADGRQRVRFQQSPKMSPYLLFLAIGDFERLEKAAGPTTISVITRKGSADKGRFALESAAQLLALLQRLLRRALPAAEARPHRGPGCSAVLRRHGELGRDPLPSRTHLLLDPRSRHRSPRSSACTPSWRTRWRTSGSATWSRWRGGTTCGSTKASPPGWRARRQTTSIRSGRSGCRPKPVASGPCSRTRNARPIRSCSLSER